MSEPVVPGTTTPTVPPKPPAAPPRPAVVHPAQAQGVPPPKPAITRPPVLNDQTTVYFARTNFRGQDRIFGIKARDRRQHMYVIGKTGVGKSVMLKNLAIQDIRNGGGMAVVDPHGELVEEILAAIPSRRINDVIYFNPADADFPIGFNVLEVPDPKYKHVVASDLMGIFAKIWAGVWSARMECIMQNCIMALLDTPGTTLLGINRLLVDREYRAKIVDNVKDPVVKQFWTHEFENYTDRMRNEVIVPIQNKVGQFLNTAMVRNIVGQPKSTFNVQEAMNSGKILLVNVSKGRIGEDNSALLGAMLITKIQLAAMERVRIPEKERNDFYLYVDEFQNFATDAFANVLSEARKYRLNLVVAHQYIGQLVTDTSTKVRDAIFGNAGTIAIFRVGAADAEYLETEFEPEFTPADIVGIPNYHIYIKLMVDGVTSRPFSATTLPPIPVDAVPGIEDKVIKVTRERYAQPREIVEERIMRRSGMPIAAEPMPAEPPPLTVPPAIPAKLHAEMPPGQALDISTPRSTSVSQMPTATLEFKPFAISPYSRPDDIPRLPQSDCLHQLFLHEVDKGLKYQYQASGESLVQYDDQKQPRQPVSVPRLRDLASSLSRVLQRLLRQPFDRLPNLQELQELGGQMYGHIFSADRVAEKLQAEPNCAYLNIHTPAELAWIPWELLWDGKWYICQHFKVARHLHQTQDESRAAESRRKKVRSGRGALILKGDTTNLSAAEYEEEELRKLLDLVYTPKTWSSTADEPDDALDRLRDDYDICHFIGHGHYDEENPTQSGWKLAKGTTLTCTEIEAQRFPQAVFPFLIFANACDSAHQSIFESEDYVRLLYHAFLRIGVPHYIGTLCEIPDHYQSKKYLESPTTEFAVHFYTSLANGLSVGEALTRARQDFFERPGAPIWAYYVHYGNPEYKFLKKPITHNLISVRHKSSTIPYPESRVSQVDSQEVFADRFAELGRLTTLLQKLAQRTPSVLLIAGEAGSGKSALLKRCELMAADHLKELAAATVELDAYAPNIPYSAFSELLHSLTRNPRRLKKPRGAAVRVGEFIAAELEPYHFLRTVFKLDQDCESSTRGHAPEPCVHDSIQRNVDHKALLAELADFLEHIAEQIPVFLAIDNLHMADDRSIASFFHLRRTLHECGILLVATYRPEAVSAMSSKYLREFLNEARLHGALGGDSSVAPINLDLSLIDERECTRVYAFVIRYLRHTLPILSATERPGFLLVRELAEYCGGNALILSELVRHLRKNNAVLLSKWGSFYDTWQLKEWAQPHHDFELPESVKELMKIRFAQLSPTLQRTLKLASIQGVEFSVEALSYLLGVDDHAVLQHLETIADRYRLIMECAARHIGSKMLTVFRFRNRSIQQYAHTQVRKLPELHKQVGEFLEHFCENKEKMKADIAGGLFEHFRISQQWDKSFNYAVQAAYRALERDQVRKAFWFFHCAVEMIPKVPGAEHIKPKLEEKLRKAGWDSRSRIDLAYCGPKLPCMMSPRLMGAYPDYTKINYKDLCEYVE